MFGNDELEATVPALPWGDSGMQRSPFAFNNNNNNNNNVLCEAKGSTSDPDSNIIYGSNSKVTVTKSNKT